jgi:hypothetical protein
VSEYQYYEFQALDRPLTARELIEVRAVSSRATVTPTRFVNHYEWGDFKGDPGRWMERYFDAFLYVATWGTHELMLRFPRPRLDLATAKRYCRGESASARTKGNLVILEFRSEDDSGGDWDEGGGWLSSIIPVRADIAAGDYRALYLAWLRCAQEGELDEDDTEPPVPRGLGRLTTPLEALAEFLRVDDNLIAAAGQVGSDEDAGIPPADLKRWIAALPEKEKSRLLTGLAMGDGDALRAELLRRFRQAHDVKSSKPARLRTAGELLAAARRYRAGGGPGTRGGPKGGGRKGGPRRLASSAT